MSFGRGVPRNGERSGLQGAFSWARQLSTPALDLPFFFPFMPASPAGRPRRGPLPRLPNSEVTARMSVDSTTLERSALERKDRDELTTIAQALGAKPPSRARKAAIVHLILELTGVGSPEAAAAGERGARPKRARTGNDGARQDATSA